MDSLVKTKNFFSSVLLADSTKPFSVLIMVSWYVSVLGDSNAGETILVTRQTFSLFGSGVVIVLLLSEISSGSSQLSYSESLCKKSVPMSVMTPGLSWSSL